MNRYSVTMSNVKIIIRAADIVEALRKVRAMYGSADITAVGSVNGRTVVPMYRKDENGDIIKVWMQ